MSAFLGFDPAALKIGLVLTHDKGTVGNRAQITFVRNRTEVRRFTPDPSKPDEFAEYRVLSALARPHELVCFQVVPQGIVPPTNLNSLEPSYKVYYGNDQPSHERRFFNWGLKRATDYGADVVAYLDVTGSFALTDLEDARDFREAAWGRVVRALVQERLGSGRREVLREALTTDAAFDDLRARLDAEGLSRG